MSLRRRFESALPLPAVAMMLALPAWPAEHGAAKPAPSELVAKADAAASRSGAAAGTEPEDPMERLRRRLAERLASPKADKAATGAGASASGAMRLVVKTPAPIKDAVTASHPRRIDPAPVTAADAHREGAAHWDYVGGAGPEAWSRLKPEFALCGKGQRQSPIDIRGGLAVDLDPVRFEYQPSRFAVVDNGHTVQVNLAPGNFIEVGGRRFELVQFHFHRPSEERIDGRLFEMSLHLVHRDDQGRLAVVALLLDKGAAQPVVQKVWNHLPLERDLEAPARVPLELADLLPNDRRYYTYMGSLTTPPCSEGVQWIVMRQPMTVAAEQIELFSRIYPMNARPIQAAAGRRIMQSQ